MLSAISSNPYPPSAGLVSVSLGTISYFIEAWEVSFPPPQEKITMLASVKININCLFIFLYVFESLIIKPRKLVFENVN